MSVALILSILKLVTMIFKEFFSWKAAQVKAQKAYDVDMKVFKALVAKSLENLTQEAREDSAQARDVEDQVDSEIKKG